MRLPPVPSATTKTHRLGSGSRACFAAGGSGGGGRSGLGLGTGGGGGASGLRLSGSCSSSTRLWLGCPSLGGGPRRRGGSFLHLVRLEHHAVVRLAFEVLLALDGAVMLAVRRVLRTDVCGWKAAGWWEGRWCVARRRAKEGEP
jgi:hypothetical protein